MKMLDMPIILLFIISIIFSSIRDVLVRPIRKLIDNSMKASPERTSKRTNDIIMDTASININTISKVIPRASRSH